MSDKAKLGAYAIVTSLVFIASALFPLCFKDSAEFAEQTLSLGARAVIFADYWNTDSRKAIAEKITDTEAMQEKYCKQRMNEILTRCNIDSKSGYTEYSGAEYLTVTTEDGSINICRMWIQRQGDWRNWTDVCFDIDTGDIYYLYTSSECVTRPESYAESVPKDIDAEYLANVIGEELGYDILNFDWSGSMADTARVIYRSGGNVLSIDISCIFYEASLLDIKIMCI